MEETELEILNDFLQETQDEFSALEKKFIQLEENPEDTQIIDSIFRPIHSIKGNSGFYGFTNVATFSHHMETLLDDLRKGKKKAAKDVIDTLLSGTDILKAMFEKITANPKDTELTEEENQYIKKIQEYTEGIQGIPKNIVPKTYDYFCKICELMHGVVDNNEQLMESEDISELCGTINKAKSEFKEVYDSITKKEKTQFDKFLFFFKGKDYTEDILSIVSSIEVLKINKECSDSSNSFKKHLNNLIDVFTQSDDNTLKNCKSLYDTIDTIVSHPLVGFEDEIVDIIDNDINEIVSIFNKQIKNERRKGGRRERESRRDEDKPPEETCKEEKTIRINQSTIDIFFDHVGELVSVEEVFKYIQKKLIENGREPSLANDLKDAIYNLDQTSQDLRKSVLETRMVPVRFILQRFPRIIRNLANELGKEVKFLTEGEDVCIDKSLLDILEDPLVHLIRNAVDHGIETPEERKKSNKPEYGKLLIKCYTKDEFAHLEIIDDGKGVNANKVKEKAIKNNLATKEELNKLSEKEIIKYILQPGFSTAEKVSGISGRGVGMDVVMSNLKKCNGVIDIETEMGKGTKMQITMPLSQTAIIKNSLLVQVKSECFAVLSEDIVEIVAVAKEKIKSTIECKYIVIRDEIIKITELADIFNINSYPLSQTDIISIVIVNTATSKVGLIVDKIINEQKIVIKKFDNMFLSDIEGFRGVSILGNGKLILVLDANELTNIFSPKTEKSELLSN